MSPAVGQLRFHSSSCFEEVPWSHRCLLPKSPNPRPACPYAPTVHDSKICKVYVFHCPDVATAVRGLDHSLPQLSFLPWSWHCFSRSVLNNEAREATSGLRSGQASARAQPWLPTPLESRPDPQLDVPSPTLCSLSSLTPVLHLLVSLSSAHPSFLACMAFALLSSLPWLPFSPHG